jgi:biotin transport system substrate-specific component
MIAAQLSKRNGALAGLVWPGAGVVRAIALVFTGTVLLALSAKVQVPFWPVPMTMQTLVVLVLGAAYGPRLGAATVIAYLAEGLAGLPIFAGVSAGPAYMMGPTAGYLVGFLAAAIICGALAERGWDRRWTTLIALMVIGHAVIFAFGVSWLASLFGWEKAIAAGIAPFVWATVLKTALAVAIMRGIWRLVSDTQRRAR